MKIIGEAGLLVPAYSSWPSQPGLYLALFHGRNNPREEMDDWGFNGPLIGPILWFHTTYTLEIKIMFASASVEHLYFHDARHPNQTCLQLVDNMVVYNGKYYGDWTVYVVSSDELR